MPDEDQPNHLLRRARFKLRSPSGSGRAMSRQELAEAVNTYVWQTHAIRQAIDQTYIGHLEQGRHHWPGALRREALRHVLGATTDKELGFYNTRGAPDVTDDLTAAAPEPQRLTRRPTPDHSIVEGFDRANGDWNSFSLVTSMLAQQRQAVAPQALLSLVEAHRDCLTTLFRSAASDPLRTQIGAMLGEASIVASRLWSAQGNRSVALAHCAYARALADRLGNPFLAATARIFESNLHSEASTLIDSDGDVMIGLRLLEEAAAASEHLSPPARARIAAEQAQTYAALNLSREAGLALDRAREAASHIAPEHRTGLYSDWNTSRVRVYEGTCQLLLEQPAKAVDTLQAVLKELATDQHNINVTLAAQVDLASAHAEAGDLEECCSLLGETFEQLRLVGNQRGIGRAQRARHRLSRWESEPAVRQLDARMNAA